MNKRTWKKRKKLEEGFKTKEMLHEADRVTENLMEISRQMYEEIH